MARDNVREVRERTDIIELVGTYVVDFAMLSPISEFAGRSARIGTALLARLIPITLVPAVIQLGGALYTIASIVLGAVFLALALAVYRTREGRGADRAAKRLFTFSLFYLFALFATLLIERSMALWIS